MLILKASALQMRMDRAHLLLLYFSLISLYINILKTLSLLKRDENFFLEKSSEGVLKSIVEQKSMR